jgi:hypothetical protein
MRSALEIIKAIHSGDVDKRNRDTCRCHVNYPYLKGAKLKLQERGGSNSIFRLAPAKTMEK